MTRYNSNTLVTFVAAALLLVVAAGCGSDSHEIDAPPPRAVNTSSSNTPPPSAARSPAYDSPAAAGLESYRNGLVAGQEQIDKTLVSLSELTDPTQTDLRGAYDRYCDNLARLVEHSDTMKREADAMRASRDEYFGKWEEKVTEIDNPTIRKSAEARRKRLRDSHERIITTSGEARDAYQPFMKDLQDIKKFLANDLSKGGIADLSDASRKVQSDGVVVKQKIGAVVTTLDSVSARE